MATGDLLTNYIYIFFVVSAYWIVSIFTVFVNKLLLSGDSVNLDAPLFVTWYQCFVTAVICSVFSKLSKMFPNRFTFPDGTPWDRDSIAKVLPLSILFTGMVGFNNLCLKYVDVSFYYIGRSLTTVFNVVLSYLILGQKTALPTLVCCGVIVGGYWLGVDQEHGLGTLSLLGAIFGVLGSLFLSMYTIHTKRVLPHIGQHILLLSYFNNAYSCILFLPLIVINQELQVILNYDRLFEVLFWILMTLGGLCGFAIGFVTTLQIQATSPLTHNISGTAKACAQTVLASYWYNEHKPWLWWLSNFIVLGGSAGYARLKQLEMEKEHKKQKTVGV